MVRLSFNEGLRLGRLPGWFGGGEQRSICRGSWSGIRRLARTPVFDPGAAVPPALLLLVSRREEAKSLARSQPRRDRDGGRKQRSSVGTGARTTPGAGDAPRKGAPPPAA